MTTRRLAVVTGASRGIGRAVAEALLAAGYDVVGAARQPVAAGFPVVPCDVADRAAVQAFFDGIRRDRGRVDVLVNNAGIAGGAAFGSEAEAGNWDAILAANLTGTWACCRAASDLLPDRTGRIINIASVLGLVGAPDQLAYTAAKHGVVGLTKALALALAPRGIAVNAICPGWVDTAMAAQRYRELGITAADAAATTPTGRVTKPEEVAALVLQIVAGGETGRIVSIDGGLATEG